MLAATLSKQLRFFSIFSKVSMAPPDPILGISVNFVNDQDSRKINLGVGAYRDDNLQPVVFSIVRKVQEELLADKTLNMVFHLLPRNTSPSTASPVLCRTVKNSSSAMTVLFSKKEEWLRSKHWQEVGP
jgi:hypothetical protein